MPVRLAFGEEERAMIDQALEYYRERGQDPGYQDYFEELYCRAFAQMMGGGYADAVATGTASLYVALAALDLPKGSEVLVSPITDPGTISAIILNGLTPRLVDSRPGSYNTGPEQVAERITAETSCALIVHAAGQAVEIDKIVETCHERGIQVLEDCSQAHGAMLRGRPVGTFGDIAAFSTMYRKASIAGPSGGVVYTQDEDLYHKALAHADRGKPMWRDDFDDRDPSGYLFPALNLHTDEISCAIGLASIGRLDETKYRRLEFLTALSRRMENEAQLCRPYGCSDADSPFYIPVFVDVDRVTCTKIEFAETVRAEGIGLNPHYGYVVAEWGWVRPYLADAFDCPNAQAARNRSFCLYVNENYGQAEVRDTLAAILKVESARACR